MLPRYCWDRANCAPGTKSYLEKMQLACEAQVASLKCEDLLKSHPEWKNLMRECNLDALCRQQEELKFRLRGACLEGFKNAAIDLGTSVKDMAWDLGSFIDSSWETMKTNLSKKDDFIRECEKSLFCKRDLVKDHPKLKSLTDEQLMNRRAEYLYTQTLSLQGSLRQPSKRSHGSSTSLSVEQNEKMNRLLDMMKDSVQTQSTRYACFHPVAQKELECYALGSIIDPALVAGYFLKGARVASAAFRIAGKASKEAKMSRRASDASQVVDEVGTFVMVPSRASALRPFTTSTISNPPKGIRIVETTNVEGQQVLSYQAKDYRSNGSRGLSTREFQLDKLTGAIDANYPAGRELFERLVKAKSGEGHLAFIDVGSLGAVNKTFKAGTEAGDRYIKAVAEKIKSLGEGKVTLARTGGDEFTILIDEKDSMKVQELLAKIRDELRWDRDGDAKAVFREEKKNRAAAYRQDPFDENRKAIDELAKIQQPDISIGATQIGGRDTLESLMESAENQAKAMKIETALKFGRSAEKYGNKEAPSKRVRPLFRADVQKPVGSSSWTQRNNADLDPLPTNLPEIKWTRVEEVKKVRTSTIARYRDETGRETFRVEKNILNPKTSQNELVSYEIPVRGNTGLLDGVHPESQKLIMDHFLSNSNGVLIMPKLKSLRYLNYFQSGTKAGDQMLEAVAEIVKKQTRSSDLSFKMGGADFLMSVDRSAAKEFSRVQKRINEEIMKSDKVQNVLRQEKELLRSQLEIAKRQGGKDNIKEIEGKIRDLESFNPNLEVRMIDRKEMSNPSSFEDIYNEFNKKFDDDK